MKKTEFVNLYLPLALSAGEAFGINPVVILAQAAIETGWGQSTLCIEHHNFFGITAYGKPNPFWSGSKTDLSENSGTSSLWFRVYASAADSFMDFARLLSLLLCLLILSFGSLLMREPEVTITCIGTILSLSSREAGGTSPSPNR